MSRPYRIVALVLMISLLAVWGLPAAEPTKTKEEQTIQKAPQRQLRAGEAAIEEALAKTIHVDFDETPLMEVINQLQDHFGIAMIIDHRALNDVGIGTDTPITASYHGMSLHSALNLMLHELGLAFTLRHEVVFITTPEEEENILITKVYDVSDLVVCRDEHNVPWDDYDMLIEAITSTVKPTSWDCVGGPASMYGISLGKAKVLVVSQTYQEQQKTAALLAEIRRIAEKHPDAPTPTHHRNQPVKARLGMCPTGGSPAAHSDTPNSPEPPQLNQGGGMF